MEPNSVGFRLSRSSLLLMASTAEQLSSTGEHSFTPNTISLSGIAVHLKRRHVLAGHGTLESVCRVTVSSLHAHADG